MSESRFLNKQVVAWALYDWGNSAFALSVLAVLFPLFLGSYWSAGDPGSVVTSRLTWATAIASLVVSLLAPVIGAIADSGGYRKRFLFSLALLGAVHPISQNTCLVLHPTEEEIPLILSQEFQFHITCPFPDYVLEIVKS